MRARREAQQRMRGAQRLTEVRLSIAELAAAPGRERLVRLFRALRRRAPWKDAVLGGAFIIEMDRGRNGSRWNVHLHALVEVRDERVLLRRLAAAWSDVRAAEDVPGSAHVCRVVTRGGDRFSPPAFYATKRKRGDWLVLSDADLGEVVLAMHGAHTSRRLGSWRGRRPPR